jgi:hypothetical protein
MSGIAAVGPGTRMDEPPAPDPARCVRRAGLRAGGVQIELKLPGETRQH